MKVTWLEQEAFATVVVSTELSRDLAQVIPVPRSIVVQPGETLRLRALTYDQTGRPVENANVAWSMVEQAAGQISSRGIFQASFSDGTYKDAVLVEAASPTTGTIVRGYADVVITRPKDVRGEPVAIRVFPSDLTVVAGSSSVLGAFAVNADGLVVPGAKIAWRVTDAAAGSVAADGRFTAGGAPGSYPSAIEATLADGAKAGIAATVNVEVISREAAASRAFAVIAPQAVTLQPGQSIQFVVSASDASGNPLSPESVAWLLADPNAGALSPEGRFTAGEATGVHQDAVTATLSVAGTRLAATASVAIITTPPLPSGPGALSRILIYPERVVVSPGESVRLAVVGTDGAGTRLPNAEITWSLSDPGMGSIGASGTITAAKEPSAHQGTVLVRAQDGDFVAEATAVLVVRGPLARVEILPPSATIRAGEKVQFSTIAYDQNGEVLPGISFVWRVTDPRAGTIDTRGLFVAGAEPGRYENAVAVTARQPIIR